MSRSGCDVVLFIKFTKEYYTLEKKHESVLHFCTRLVVNGQKKATQLGLTLSAAWHSRTSAQMGKPTSCLWRDGG